MGVVQIHHTLTKCLGVIFAWGVLVHYMGELQIDALPAGALWAIGGSGLAPDGGGLIRLLLC